MSNFSNDTAAGSLLDGAQLKVAAAQLPAVRKGGVDPAAVTSLIDSAAGAIDSLHTHTDALQAEVTALAAERDAARDEAARAQELLAGSDDPELEAAGATSLLANARRVSNETLEAARAQAADIVEAAHRDAEEARSGIDAARTEAADIVDAARAEAAEIVAGARAAAEAEVADLRAQIDELAARRDAEAASLETQLAQFQAAAAEAHRRAVGSLQAALALVEGYVAEHADTEAVSEGEAGDAPDTFSLPVTSGSVPLYPPAVADTDSSEPAGGTGEDETPQ